jgi:aspartate/methionine/tyrosine aminotransferase
MKIDPSWNEGGPVSARTEGAAETQTSISWRMSEFLIKHARLGSVPGADFGRAGEGYVRFCFARERRELTAALQSMQQAINRSSVGLRR